MQQGRDSPVMESDELEEYVPSDEVVEQILGLKRWDEEWVEILHAKDIFKRALRRTSKKQYKKKYSQVLANKVKKLSLKHYANCSTEKKRHLWKYFPNTQFWKSLPNREMKNIRRLKDLHIKNFEEMCQHLEWSDIIKIYELIIVPIKEFCMFAANTCRERRMLHHILDLVIHVRRLERLCSDVCAVNND